VGRILKIQTDNYATWDEALEDFNASIVLHPFLILFGIRFILRKTRLGNDLKSFQLYTSNEILTSTIIMYTNYVVLYII